MPKAFSFALNWLKNRKRQTKAFSTLGTFLDC